MARNIKWMVLGDARHGKDSVCEILTKRYGLKFVSSSMFVAEKAVRPWLITKGIHYPSIKAMYDDRGNHRADWYDAICDYNTPDPARLGKELFAQYDIYCGLRSKREFDAMKDGNVFDFSIWVDAGERLPPEDKSSISVTRADADYILNNNGPEDDLIGRVDAAWEFANKFLISMGW